MIESVEWNSLHLSPDDLIDCWSVAADIVAVLRAVIRVEAATEENIGEVMASLKRKL